MVDAATVTPLEGIRLLTQISRDLDYAGDQLADWERKAVKARETYTVAYNVAYLAAEGPIPERKAIAENNTHNERMAAESADAEVRIWRAKIRIMERRVDVGRSTVAVLRTEAHL